MHRRVLVVVVMVFHEFVMSNVRRNPFHGANVRRLHHFFESDGKSTGEFTYFPTCIKYYGIIRGIQY